MSLSLKTIALFIASMPTLAQAQSSRVEVEKMLNYRQPTAPKGIDTYQYSTYYYNGKEAYNLKGFSIGTAKATISDFCFSPAGSSFALIAGKKGVNSLTILDPWNTGKVLHDFKDALAQPVAVAYSSDSRRLFVATENGTLHVFDARQWTETASWSLPFTPRQLTVSPNDYFVAAVGGSDVVIVNQETGGVRSRLYMPSTVNDLQFSKGSDQMGIATNGTLTVYSTHTFQPTATFEGLGSAASIAFHPDGKYVAVLTGPSEVTFVNTTDPTDRPTLTDATGGLSQLRFVRDGKKKPYLVYSTQTALVYKVLKGLSPHYAKLLADELRARMAEWSRMRPDETMEQYQERVSEEGRLRQARLFEQEIATRMADELVTHSEVTLGSYNPETGVLTLGFNNMPQIFLTVPEGDVSSFKNSDDLEFQDVVYGLTKDDSFEIIYAKVVNKRTGKSYVFDNLDRHSLDFLQTDDSFIPIELVQQTGMQDVRLQAIKDDVVSEAKKENLISDHTQITVNSAVEADVDADGRHINNYRVSFNYTVTGNYSIKEDFAPGRYRIEQSHAAVSMLNIIIRAFEKDFAQYVQPGKKLVVKLTGSADAMKINGAIAYDGCYGEFQQEPFFLNGQLGTLDITRSGGIRKNEQLAFLRAQGVKNYIDSHIPSLRQMNVEYRNYVELLEGTGGEYRRINVEFTFVDAFNNN